MHLRLLTFVAFAGLIQVAQAQTTFTFCQEGYSEGAFISGSFTGSDVDTDGQIVSISPGEVTDFNASFSGNSSVAPVSFAFGDLFGLVYDDDGGPLGDGTGGFIEGIGASNAGGDFFAGPGPGDVCGDGVDCAEISDGSGTDTSQELIVINGGACGAPPPPPEPVPAMPLSLLALLAVLAGGLGLIWRRQRI